jgi:hypothetical protein
LQQPGREPRLGADDFDDFRKSHIRFGECLANAHDNIGKGGKSDGALRNFGREAGEERQRE